MSNVMKPLYLLAGRSEKVPDPFIGVVFRENGIPAPTIACVGAANGDDPVFRNRMTVALSQAGAGRVDRTNAVC